ncbi:MFS transporter [Tsuneonella sp. HG094]
MRLAISRHEFIAMMAMIQALQALGFAALLPALDMLASDLGVAHANERQWIIAAFLLSSGLFSLIPGTISDRVGRKPMALACMAAFACINFVSALVQTFEQLIVLRVLLGISSSALAVLPLAIIRDLYHGEDMAKLQSFVAMMFMAVPIFAPGLGYVLMAIAGWRIIFVAIGAVATGVAFWYLFRLPETLPPPRRRVTRARALLGNMRLVLQTRSSIGYVLGTALVFGAHFGFINSAQQLIGEHFGAGARFALIFGLMATSMMAASLANSALIHRFGTRPIAHAAILCHLLVSLAQVYFASRPGETLLLFVLLMSANMCLLITIFVNFTVIALQPFGALAGAAASVQTFFRLVLGAGLGAMIGQAYDGTPLPLAYALVAVAGLSVVLVLFSERGKLFRPLGTHSGT